MHTCGMCGLEHTTRKALEDHTHRAHRRHPDEIAETLTAGQQTTAEDTATRWEQWAAANGHTLPDLRTARPDEPRRAMRPGGYL